MRHALAVAVFGVGLLSVILGVMLTTTGLPLPTWSRAGAFLLARAAYWSGSGLLVVLIAEAVELGWRRSSLRALLPPRVSSAVVDAGLYALARSGMVDVALAAVSLGLYPAMLAARLPGAGLFASGVPTLDAVNYFVIYTLADYWYHRAFHSRVLWPLHRLHHSAAEMTCLTSARNHPLAVALSPIVRIWPAALVGLSPMMLTLLTVAQTPWHFLIHSRLPWDFGAVGRLLLASPASHWVHHSRRPEHEGRNLSLVPLWDHAFGTWSAPVAGDSPQIGCD